MAGDGLARLRHHHMPVPAENLRGALCVGTAMFTADHLDRREIVELLMSCQQCPVLAACAEDRDRWRAASPYDWSNFSGVWAGRAYTRGQPTGRIGALP